MNKFLLFTSIIVDDLTTVYPMPHTHLTIYLIHFEFIGIQSAYWLSYNKVIRTLAQWISMIKIAKKLSFNLSYSFMQCSVYSPWRIEYLLRHVLSPVKFNNNFSLILDSASHYFFLIYYNFWDISTVNILNENFYFQRRVV